MGKFKGILEVDAYKNQGYRAWLFLILCIAVIVLIITAGESLTRNNLEVAEGVKIELLEGQIETKQSIIESQNRLLKGERELNVFLQIKLAELDVTLTDAADSMKDTEEGLKEIIKILK